MIILKQIVWETQQWHYKISRPSSSWVIDQNKILPIFTNNSQTVWSTHSSFKATVSIR